MPLSRVVAAMILALASIIVMLYPVVITQLSNLEQMRVASQYSDQETQLTSGELEESFQAAQYYNKTRNTGPILDPWLARISEDNLDYQSYLEQLHTAEAMGRLQIPSIDVDLPIYHGTGEDSLQRGVGHLYGSDLPVGGANSHAVLTAHSGLTTATLFDNLKDIKNGDQIYISVAGQQLKYEVYETEVVLPNETQSLHKSPGKDLVTLITCTPYGLNTHRLLVHARAVPMSMADQEILDSNSNLVWAWWMWVLIATSTTLTVTMARWSYLALKKRKIEAGEKTLFADRNQSISPPKRAE